MSFKEIKITTPDIEIAAKQWGDPSKQKILALHGWLDNAATYDQLAPLLPNHCLIAVDLPGHGFSQHRAEGVNLHFIDEAITLIEIINILKLDPCVLMGHSLGGGIASIAAGYLKERISKLILIEALGPLSSVKGRAVNQFDQHMSDRIRFRTRKIPIYKGIDTMVDLRLASGGIERSSVEILMQRGTKKHEEGYTWRTDPRLRMKSSLRMCEEQIQEFLGQITAPTLLIEGSEGVFHKMDYFRDRKKCIKNLKTITLTGGHYLHLDNPEPVAQEINRFLFN